MHNQNGGRRWIGFLLVCYGLVLTVIGSVLSNLVIGSLPPSLENDALLLLGLVVLGEMCAAVVLSYLQGSTRSTVRRRITIGVTILAELLAACGGVLSNVASASLPSELAFYALPLFLTATLLGIGGAIIGYRLSYAPIGSVRRLAQFAADLQDRYSAQLALATRDQKLIPLTLQDASLANTPPLLDIREAFEAANRSMFIIGAAGAGKTTSLVALASDLLRTPVTDEHGPLPVIFNLATWAANRRPLGEWMVEELVSQPNRVAPKVAADWIKQNAILPFLDGLDEVEHTHRKECLEAIQTFADNQSGVLVVVTCRQSEFRSEFRDLPQPHTFSVFEIRSLSDEQIRAYLSDTSRFGPLLFAIDSNSALHDLMRIPLFLSTASRTWSMRDEIDLPPVDDTSMWASLLLDKYVDRMLAHQRGDERGATYMAEQTRRWLAWLAYEMRSWDLLTFSPDAMNELFLYKTTQWFFYERMSRRICNWLDRISLMLMLGFTGAALYGLVGALLFGALALAVFSTMRYVGPPLDEVPDGLMGGILGGIASSLLYGVPLGMVGGLLGGIVGWSVGSLPYRVQGWHDMRFRPWLLARVLLPLYRVHLWPWPARSKYTLLDWAKECGLSTCVLGGIVSVAFAIVFGPAFGTLFFVKYSGMLEGAALGVVVGASFRLIVRMPSPRNNPWGEDADDEPHARQDHLPDGRYAGSLFGGMFAWWVVREQYKPGGQLLPALAVGLLLGLVLGAFFGLFLGTEPGDEISHTRPVNLSMALNRSVVWLPYGLVSALVYGLPYGVVAVLALLSFTPERVALAGGVIVWFVGGWTRINVKENVLHVLVTVGFVGFLTMSVFVLSIGRPITFPGDAFLLILSFLAYAAAATVTGNRLDIRTDIGSGNAKSNFRIYGAQSAYISVRAYRLIVGLTFGVALGLSASAVKESTNWMSVGLAIGLITGVLYSLDTVVRYIVFRWAAIRANVVPLQYHRFLAYAVSHVLLQRTEREYAFMHLLFRDYFADMWVQTMKAEGIIR